MGSGLVHRWGDPGMELAARASWYFVFVTHFELNGEVGIMGLDVEISDRSLIDLSRDNPVSSTKTTV